MADLSTWLFVIAPFTVTALVLLAWVALILVQTPRPYWKDVLNWSIAGVIICTALYYITRAQVRAGLPPLGEWQTRFVLTLMGTFALMGAPRTFRQLYRAIRERGES